MILGRLVDDKILSQWGLTSGTVMRRPRGRQNWLGGAFVDGTIWLALVVATILTWSATSLLYKAGVRDKNEKYICLKYSVCIGLVFFVIALLYLIIRDEPFTIWESAVRYWPVTVYGLVYAVINTVSFNGFVYNEATVESPVERVSSGISTILLVFTFLALGRADSISELLTPLTAAGILLMLVSIILLSMVRNKANRESMRGEGARWMTLGVGTLVFPLLFALGDGVETIVTGVCLDSTFGYAMPEGDSVIIIGMEYAAFALAFWLYVSWKEKRPYNPFTRYSAPRMLGALADNVGIVLYAYAMALNSVSTDPVIAVYPVIVMIGGRVFMKEKVSAIQYALLLGVVAGGVMVVAGTVL
jgi:hypothetical protein